MTGKHGPTSPPRAAPSLSQLERAIDRLAQASQQQEVSREDWITWLGDLDRIRKLFRQHPQLFDRQKLETLKAVKERIDQRTLETPQRLLSSLFGYSDFRRGQAEIIRSVLAGKDCIGIMPTGAGKSLTYQIPARCLGGTTLVLSPLISLMKDQVDALSRVGMRATFLNSSLQHDEYQNRLLELRKGTYELVYLAPEGLGSAAGRALSAIDLQLIAVDEAHCISQWGHDFRPAYRALSGLKERFSDTPILALTATATAQVARDIAEQLLMRRPALYRGSFFRKNLHLHVIKKGQQDDGRKARPVGQSIAALVATHQGKSGIVYCLSRRSTERTTDQLTNLGVKARAYHAGLDPEHRNRVQDAFREGDIDVVVATIAFGMGIDKGNVRYVIHRDMPRSIESYYQEIGRAGRDGKRSDCYLFYSWNDVTIYDRFEGDSRLPGLVRQMFSFAEEKGCLHQRLVAHFGQELAPCGSSCDPCVGASPTFSSPPKVKKTKRNTRTKTDPELLSRLKDLRHQLASERGVPAFVIFGDKTLIEMAARSPRSPADLLGIHGVGPSKLSSYGEAFLEVIANYAGH